ncbi:ABC transporter permease [Mycolicibacterium confluentis]|uniref:ABC transporter permease n=1 Tax=Mycolicibacterium confluentis TaxID=28047 RepID=A0A7I7XTW2_9MYCO|nr:ABC transporter permease [Mycolicibacterium confluentis]MCV7320887.1 ABC transporter permease [Mycolicibacterium confluentis]BBZ32710.1 ABC transporter permease [Mycolicibacterium confluentis]
MTPPAPADGRRVPRLLALPGTVWLLLLFVVPFGFVVAASVGSTDAVGRILYGWSTANYELAFDGVILPIVWRSVSYAAIATAVCLVVGYPTAYVIARYGGRWRTALVLAVLVPWLVSYIIRIYAWQQLLADGGLANALLREVGLGDNGFRLLGTSGAVVTGLVYNYLPLAILPMYAAIDRLDPRVLEAGRDLYGSRRAVFWHVALPETRAGVAIASGLVFVLSLGDWATASLLGGADQYMIGNLIQDQVNSQGSLPFGAVLSVLLLAVIAVGYGGVRFATLAVRRPW